MSYSGSEDRGRLRAQRFPALRAACIDDLTAGFGGHARAEAIDVAAFVLADGRRISVLGDWNAGEADEREFLRTVQRSACKRFGTVLGPDYNAAHANHFHLEEGNGSFCR